MNAKTIDFTKGNGIVPAIIQDDRTGMVLMLGYMNREAFTKTRQTKLVWFWSRSRGTLWQKGETSGNILQVVSMTLDCDGDAVLVRVNPKGPTCHTGRISCFTEREEIA